MAKFGLIGRNISYSFSQKYFEQKFKKLFLNGYSYDLFDVKTVEEAALILKKSDLNGLNVTIPYKEKIIPYLDSLDEISAEIGAVNCIKISDGQSKGYNTDAFGFEKTLELAKNPHQKAFVLGDGGAAKAVKYVLKSHGISFKSVTRSGEITFDDLDEEQVDEHTLIVQCTPVGTYPDVENCLDFPFRGLSERHFVIDLIYNPEVTKFLKNSAERGAQTSSGLYMLEQQAEKAWQIWNS